MIQASNNSALRSPAPAPLQAATTNDVRPLASATEHGQSRAQVATTKPSPAIVSSSNLAPALPRDAHDAKQMQQTSTTNAPAAQAAQSAVTNGSAISPTTANGTTASPVPAQAPAELNSDGASMPPPALRKEEPKPAAAPSAGPTVLNLDTREPRPQSVSFKRDAEADEEDKNDTKRQKIS